VPIYEYICASCGERFDRLQGSNDPAPACSACGHGDVRRTISLIAGLAGSSRPSASAGCGCGGACACGRN
jgi:putative FmdB family regulatory protein